MIQIDGFKLHVSHVPRPYYGRLRQAPTTLQRIEKDLQQVKQLASILEDEYAMLRTMKSGAPEPKPDESKSAKDGEQDFAMAEEQPASTNEVENAEPEPDVDSELFERGSEAVERRIEKLALELLTQQENGDGDGSDSKFESNKVRRLCYVIVTYILFIPSSVFLYFRWKKNIFSRLLHWTYMWLMFERPSILVTIARPCVIM